VVAAATGLLEQAQGGEVDDAAFLACVRASLPYAWDVIAGLVTELEAGGGEFADNRVPPSSARAQPPPWRSSPPPARSFSTSARSSSTANPISPNGRWRLRSAATRSGMQDGPDDGQHPRPSRLARPSQVFRRDLGGDGLV
jgi:hypothetical protein